MPETKWRSMCASEPITRREYLTIKRLLGGTHWDIAVNEVASTALANPEWDMEETKTFNDWEKTKHV